MSLIMILDVFLISMGWVCLLWSTNMSIRGCMADGHHRKSGSTSIRFLNLDFIMSKDENAVSHRCVDGKGI